MADGSITLDTSIDSSGLQKAIDALNNLLKKFSKQANTSFSDLDDSIESSAKKAEKLKITPTTDGINDAVRSLDNLNAKIETQSALLENYQYEYDRVSQRFGSTSTQALKLRKSILYTEESISKMTKKSDELAEEIRKAESAMQSGAKSANDLGEASKKSGENMEKGSKGAGTFQVALGNLVSSGLEKAVSAAWNLVDSTRELRTDISFLKQNIESAGMSYDKINAKTREAYAVTGELDSSVEAVSNLLASGFNENQLVDALDAITGAYVKFPDTMKIESLADSLQETIATGEATGQFSELLGRLGVNVEGFNEKISSTESTSKRVNLALQELAKSGLTETYAEYKNNNQALLEGAVAQYDYNMAVASIAEVIEPLKSGILAQFSELIMNNGEAIQVVGDIIYQVLSVILAAINVIAKLPPQLTIIIGLIILAVTAFVKIKSAIDDGTGAIGKMAKAFSETTSPLMKTLGIVLLLIGAFSLLLLLILAIKEGTENAKSALNSFSNVQVPTVNPAQVNQRGYASGTSSAARGLAWVGENGPELVDFKGGETVYNATQSAAIAGMYRNKQPSVSNYYVTIDAKNVKEFNDVVRIAQNARQYERSR